MRILIFTLFNFHDLGNLRTVLPLRSDTPEVTLFHSRRDSKGGL